MNSNEISIALISAVSALGGALIGVVGSIIINYQNLRNERLNRRIDLRVNYYLEFIESMQIFMNDSSANNFNKFQQAINKVILISNAEVAKNINTYYRALIKNVSERNLREAQHNEYQRKIINSIRRDLKSSNKELEDVYLVQYQSNS